MTARMTIKQRKHIIEVQPIFWMLAAIMLFALLSAFEHADPRYMPELLNEHWILAGEHVEELPDHVDVHADEVTMLERVLDERFETQQTLCFYSVYEDITIKLNDTVFYTFKRPEAESIVRAAPCYWNVVTIPGDAEGSKLTIELKCPYEYYANTIGEIRVGSYDQVNAYVTRMTLPKLLMAVGILGIAIVFSVIALYMRYYVSGSTGMYSLSIALLVLAVFLVTQQTTVLLKLYSGTSYVMIQCLAFMLCPVMVTRYLARTYQKGWKIGARVLYIISLINLTTVILLQVLGAADMPEALIPTRILCVLMVAYIFLMELVTSRRAVVLIFAAAMGYGLYHYYRTGAITWLIYPGIVTYIYVLGYRLINTVLKSKMEEVQLRTELEVSRSELATVQISSHFFYHTLDSIRALIRIDSDKAYKMTGDFAKYLRYRVDGVERMEEKVMFSRELRSIRAYTYIKQAQLGDRFVMEFDTTAEDFEILPLTVQPLVENAVIHAVQKRKEGGLVRLVCREEKNFYHIEVIDNGPGDIHADERKEDPKESTAIHNVNTRLAWYGVAPVKMEKNELGGMTVSLNTPKVLKRKEEE